MNQRPLKAGDVLEYELLANSVLAIDVTTGK
jgi:hypothetical protein